MNKITFRLQWALIIFMALASFGLILNALNVSDIAQLGFTPLIIILVIFIYIWAKELIGRWWALLPAFLFAFSPAVIANGFYLTSNISATLGAFASVYYFVKFLLLPTKKHLILAGLAFGIAQLIGFPVIFLALFFIFLTIIFIAVPFVKIKANKFVKHALKQSILLLAIFAIGGSVIYAAYFLSDFSHIIFYDKILEPLAHFSAENNFQWSNALKIFFTKEPLPSLILIGLALFLSIWNIIKQFKSKNLKFKLFADYLSTHFAEFSMLIFTISYFAYLMIKSPIELDIRLFMPAMPFIYILSAGALKKWVNKKIISQTYTTWQQIFKIIIDFIRVSIKKIFIAILVIWYLAGTLF